MDIEEADMRVIVRLLGETAAVQGGLMHKKLYLLDGLCDFVGSGEWAWALTSARETPDSFLLRRKIGVPFDWPTRLPEASGAIVRVETFPDHAPSHVISSDFVLNPEAKSKILLLRDPEEPAYSLRETHLASLVLDEIPWLHWREWKSPQPCHDKLSPRLQWTLDLLLLGMGRKEIADQIGISEGTVSGYIRGLYQHFEVNSQAELMRLHLQEPAMQSPDHDKSRLQP